jgi:hypothetical protein
VADVDAVHAKAVEQGFEIVYPLRDEQWESGASCSASRAARSSTSCPTAPTERPAGESRRESKLRLVRREPIEGLSLFASPAPRGSNSLEAPRPRRDTSDVTLDLRKLLITIIVVWLVVSAALIVLSFFGESEGSGTALRLL